MSGETPDDKPLLMVNWQKLSTRAKAIYYLLASFAIVLALLFGLQVPVI